MMYLGDKPVKAVLSLLPDEYQEVEYIQSTGTQYIDTGFNPTSNTKVEADLQFFNWDTSKTNASFIGTYESSGSSFSINFGATANEDNQLFCWVNKGMNYGGTYTNVVVERGTPTERNTLILTNSFVEYGGVSATLQKGSWERLNVSLIVFGRKNVAQDIVPFNRYNMRLYRMKIYDDDNLVRDYIPCYRKSDNEIGLYDLVNKVFYTNNGTGTFLKGENKTTILEFTAPIKKCVGKNLFNKNNPNIFNGTFLSGSYEIKEERLAIYISCKEDTTYTISRLSGNPFMVVCSTEEPANGVSYSINNGGTTFVDFGTAAGVGTYTTADKANWLAILVYGSSNKYTAQEIIDSLQIEENSTATEYEPYTEWYEY